MRPALVPGVRDRGAVCSPGPRARARTAGRARPRGAARGPRKNGTWESDRNLYRRHRQPRAPEGRGEAELARGRPCTWVSSLM